MLSFKKFVLLESETLGNYVSTNVQDPQLPRELIPKSGTEVPAGDHHLTLVYSEFSEVDSRVLNNLIGMLPPEMDLKVVGATVFPSKEKPTEKGTLVLTVQNGFVDQLHQSLISLGMQHSFPEYAQHVTLAYDADLDEAWDKSYQIGTYLQNLPEPLILNTNGYNSEPINKDYVKNLK